MAPYKKWLANVSASETIRRELDKHNSSFREFIERTQIHSRESANATGGFKEFLAEPFQRVSRYRLMIDRKRTSLLFWSFALLTGHCSRSNHPASRAGRSQHRTATDRQHHTQRHLLDGSGRCNAAGRHVLEPEGNHRWLSGLVGRL